MAPNLYIYLHSFLFLFAIVASIGIYLAYVDAVVAVCCVSVYVRAPCYYYYYPRLQT